MFHFYNPWKRQKVLMFSGGMEMEYWLDMVNYHNDRKK